MKSLIVFTLLLVGVFGIEFDRPCRDDIGAVQNFNSNFYSGIWYEIQNSVNRDNEECVDHRYTRRLLNDIFDVERFSVIDGDFVSVTRTAEPTDPEDPLRRAIFNATTEVDGEDFHYNYRVLITDYTNYAIIWQCTDIADDRSIEEGAILGRGTTINQSSWVKIDAYLESVGMDRNEFRVISHTPEACGLAPPPE